MNSFRVMKKYYLLFLFLITVLKLSSQDIKTNETGSWHTLINKFTISDKLYAVNVSQLRMVEFAKDTRIFLLVPSLNYNLNKSISVGLGYVHLNFSQTGIRIPTLDYEDRIFQHVSLNTAYWNVKIGHRFMMEERFKTKLDNGSAYANRFRYRLNFDFNVLRLTNGKHILGKISEELRVRFESGLRNPEFDQNNFSALVGYKMFNNSKLYLGYGRDFYKNGKSDYWGDHLLHVVVNYNFDFSKKKLVARL
jgi:hypothetical protein